MTPQANNKNYPHPKQAIYPALARLAAKRAALFIPEPRGSGTKNKSCVANIMESIKNCAKLLWKGKHQFCKPWAV